MATVCHDKRRRKEVVIAIYNGTRIVSRGHGCPRCCEIRIFSQTKAKNNIFMIKGQSLWKPQDDMDYSEI